jgi:hypothetical protein
MRRVVVQQQPDCRSAGAVSLLWVSVLGHEVQHEEIMGAS